MTDPIANVTTTALALALDAATLRQQAITSNIANVNTPGYAPLAVSFEEQLQDARRALQSGRALDGTELADVQPALQAQRSPGGATPAVQLDMEAARLAQNSMHFQVLLKGLSKHYAVMSTAVSDGRK
jgi:flagellar basal-body rod protein FlgB